MGPTPDLVNGAFEMLGGVLLWMNVRQIVRDKKVEGLWWPSTVFFCAWGLWNLYYYPALGQWWSFAGGLNIVVANATWLALWWFYAHRVALNGRALWLPTLYSMTASATGWGRRWPLVRWTHRYCGAVGWQTCGACWRDIEAAEERRLTRGSPAE